MNEYIELKEAIGELFTRNYYKKAKSWYLTAILGIAIVCVFIWYGMVELSKLSFENDAFLYPIFYTILTIVIITVLLTPFIGFLSVLTSYHKHIKNNKPHEITTANQFQKLYIDNKIKKYIQQHKFSTEIINSSNERINRFYVSFDYVFEGKKYHVKTENFKHKYDGGAFRIEAHIVRENIIFGLLKGDILHITIFNS